MSDHDIVTVVPGARSLVRRVLRPVMRTWLRLDVEGEQRVRSDGPVIIASTHTSHADSVALGCALERPVYFLGDLRLTRWPILGPWLPKLGMVPVERGTADTEALRRLTELLDAGEAVVVYPEGSRSRDGRVYRPRSGVARLAAATRVPVVPAAVVGTFELWPSGSGPRIAGGPVTVRFGAEIAAPHDDPGARRAFNDHLHDVLVDLAGKPRAEAFAPVNNRVENREAA